MQFSEMYGELETHLGSNARLTASSSAKSKEFINRMYLQLARSYRFYELDLTDTSKSTVAGTATVAVPTGTREIISIRDTTNKIKLIKRDIEWYEGQDQSSDAQGVPEFYLRYGSNIVLWPTPDGAYALQIRYLKLPDELSDDADVPVYPEDWHEVIVLLATSRAAYWLGLDTKAMNYKSEALGLISALTEDITSDKMHGTGQLAVARTRRAQGHQGNANWPQSP